MRGRHYGDLHKAICLISQTTSLSFLLFLAAAQDAEASEFSCPTIDASLVAENSRDAMLACEGIERALRFLQAQGLDVDTTIKIEIVHSLVGNGSHAIAGHFYKGSNKAVILDYVHFAALSTWLKVPITESLYRSVAAHEAAHIVALDNFKIAAPTVQAQEYIAYVTTLATLEPVERKRVMAKYPGDGYDTDQQMNTTIYLCDPMRFGVEAYRHFIKKGKAMNYIQKILDGDVLTE